MKNKMEWLKHLYNQIIDELLMDNIFFTAVFSIAINIFISIIGVLPTFFITAMNITLFGLKTGIVVSILGESLGAIISFILYRKGISASKLDGITRNKYFVKLKNAQGNEWIFLLFAFRIVPFIPSSVVTVAASFSNIHIVAFSIISTIGKIPALLLEALIVINVIEASQGSLILMVAASVMVLGYLIFKMKRNKKRNKT
ncbi:hypothetical protein B1B00_08970 [Bacillus sp. DSM 27956]|nr:hypothetical protein B1B00_08970 [Bacillus sp. DSM 27956]